VLEYRLLDHREGSRDTGEIAYAQGHKSIVAMVWDTFSFTVLVHIEDIKAAPQSTVGCITVPTSKHVEAWNVQ
jgi:hypothetical protein